MRSTNAISHAAALLAAVALLALLAGCPRKPTLQVRALGGLLLACQPGDAEVYVDDRYLGTVSGLRGKPLALRAGRRRLQLSREGYFDHFAEVSVVKGVRQRLEIKLRRRPF